MKSRSFLGVILRDPLQAQVRQWDRRSWRMWLLKLEGGLYDSIANLPFPQFLRLWDTNEYTFETQCSKYSLWQLFFWNSCAWHCVEHGAIWLGCGQSPLDTFRETYREAHYDPLATEGGSQGGQAVQPGSPWWRWLPQEASRGDGEVTSPMLGAHLQEDVLKKNRPHCSSLFPKQLAYWAPSSAFMLHPKLEMFTSQNLEMCAHWNLAYGHLLPSSWYMWERQPNKRKRGSTVPCNFSRQLVLDRMCQLADWWWLTVRKYSWNTRST